MVASRRASGRSARSAASAAVTVLSNAASRAAGREPRRPHPGGPEHGGLLKRERGLAEAEPERRGPSVSACAAEHPGQPSKAAQGDQEACHSRGSRRGLRKMDQRNIIDAEQPLTTV